MLQAPRGLQPPACGGRGGSCFCPLPGPDAPRAQLLEWPTCLGLGFGGTAGTGEGRGRGGTSPLSPVAPHPAAPQAFQVSWGLWLPACPSLGGQAGRRSSPGPLLASCPVMPAAPGAEPPTPPPPTCRPAVRALGWALRLQTPRVHCQHSHSGQWRPPVPLGLSSSAVWPHLLCSIQHAVPPTGPQRPPRPPAGMGVGSGLWEELACPLRPARSVTTCRETPPPGSTSACVTTSPVTLCAPWPEPGAAGARRGQSPGAGGTF